MIFYQECCGDGVEKERMACKKTGQRNEKWEEYSQREKK